MTSEQFKLLGTLPGLYYARDYIQSEIDRIESQFGTGTKKLGRPLGAKNKPKDESIQVKTEQKYDSLGRRIAKRTESPDKAKKMSNIMKKHWANMTPEQKEARRKKMTAAIRKSWKVRKTA